MDRRSEARDPVTSRIGSTTALIDAMATLPPEERPAVLVNTSGIDYYGDRPDGILTESSPPGDSFLAEVTASWERVASAAIPLGVRVAVIRTAFVVARDAPAFRLMVLPFRMFVGGPLGSGTQWFTWIHVDDLVGIYRLAATDPGISGPVNAVAPDVRTQSEVARVVGSILHRPARLRVPAGVLRVAMGELADLLLHGRRAAPRAAVVHGCRFQFPTMDAAFADALGKPATTAAAQANSPFDEGVLATNSATLPKAFRQQFLGTPGDGRDAPERDHGHDLAPPCLAPTVLLVPCPMVALETGQNVPATMVVRNHRTDDGRPWQTWERTFDFGHVRRRIRRPHDVRSRPSRNV